MVSQIWSQFLQSYYWVFLPKKVIGDKSGHLSALCGWHGISAKGMKSSKPQRLPTISLYLKKKYWQETSCKATVIEVAEEMWTKANQALTKANSGLTKAERLAKTETGLTKAGKTDFTDSIFPSQCGSMNRTIVFGKHSPWRGAVCTYLLLGKHNTSNSIPFHHSSVCPNHEGNNFELASAARRAVSVPSRPGCPRYDPDLWWREHWR